VKEANKCCYQPTSSFQSLEIAHVLLLHWKPHGKYSHIVT
jgi:hypothetical protein